jgi:hypothetical protein
MSIWVIFICVILRDLRASASICFRRLKRCIEQSFSDANFRRSLTERNRCQSIWFFRQCVTAAATFSEIGGRRFSV